MSVTAMSIPLPITGVGRRTIATVAAIGSAVLLPQVFHMAGAAIGAGPAFAQSWLPMFLPVMIAGLLAGPAVGLIVGAASPLVAFVLAGMPAAAMLPGMIVWLAVLGLVAGFVSARHLHPAVATALVVATVPAVSFLWMTAASLFAGTGFAAAAATWSAYWLTGVPGLIAQIALVGLATVLISRRK